MFGKMFKKKTTAAKVAIHKVENRDLMEAIVAGAVMVMFADGDASAEELNKLTGIIENNDNLKHFGSEIGTTVDRFSGLYEAGARIGTMKLMKELEDVSADEDQKVEAFLIAIEIADADGEIDEKEYAVLQKIGKAFGLNPDTYI